MFWIHSNEGIFDLNIEYNRINSVEAVRLKSIFNSNPNIIVRYVNIIKLGFEKKISVLHFMVDIRSNYDLIKVRIILGK